MYQALYDSPWHHPGAAYLGGALVLAWAWWRRPRLLPLLLVLEAAILLDASLTGVVSPLSGVAATIASIVFVVAGDLRFFYLLERQSRERGAALGAAFAWAFAPSLLLGAAQAVEPELFAEKRVVFLSYELVLLGMAIGRGLSLARLPDDPLRRWLAGLCAFEALQYGLWVLADVAILRGSELALLGRIVPNLLYYVAFVPFALGTAPEQARA